MRKSDVIYDVMTTVKINIKIQLPPTFYSEIFTFKQCSKTLFTSVIKYFTSYDIMSVCMNMKSYVFKIVLNCERNV